jgi:hypothetical protein
LAFAGPVEDYPFGDDLFTTKVDEKAGDVAAAVDTAVSLL